jgi:hypothetical protein
MINDTESRVIHLAIRKPFFESYLRHIFTCPEGRIKITRCDDIGKFLYSRVRYTDRPIKKPTGQMVQLILPHHETDMSDKHFISYTEDDMVRINDYIEACAYLDFRTYIQVGRNDMKIDRKVVVNIFSNVILGEDKYEMLVKDEYRRRKKIHDFLIKSIQEFGY